MANIPLDSESACVISANHSPYSAYRHAKAAWDVVLFAPEYENDDVPEEINDPLSDAHCAALEQYMLTPADTIAELGRKLDVFHDEEAWGLYAAPAFVAALAEDARRLAR